MTDPDIDEKLELFESRLMRLEALLGINKPRHAEQLSVEAIPVEEIMPVYTPPIPVDMARQMPPPLPVSAKVIPLVTPPTPVANNGLEQTIGLKWAGWIGAVVLVIGAAFGIKYGYDQGWFTFVTPAVRLGLLTLVGFALIGSGEWVYRRVNVLSAVGLFGAGVAVLFVISYAGHAYYGLYERHTAFAFMALSTVIGAAVARRGQMVSIAVLAMIGGNLAPIFLTNGQSEYFGFLTYVLLLQITSLLLAAWGGTPKWWTLRGLSLATTSIWVAAVIHICPQQMMLLFVLIYAALFHAELHFSAHRSRFNAASAGVTFSMLVTTALTMEILYLQRDGTRTDRLISVLGLAMIVAVISFVCHRAKKDSAPLRALGVGYAIQSMALFAVAVPIAFSGIWITAAWCTLAVAYAAAGRLLNLSTAKFAAPVAWLLAGFNLFLWINNDFAGSHRNLIAFSVIDCAIPIYLVMSGVLAITGRVVAGLSHPKEPGDFAGQFAPALSVLSSIVWIVAVLAALSSVAATAAMLMYAILLLIEDRLFSDRVTLIQSVIIIVLATIKWAAMDTLLRRLNDPIVIEPVILGPHGLIGGAVLASSILLYFVAATTKGAQVLGQQARRTIIGLIVGVVLWIGTFGIDQAFINDHLSASPAFGNTAHAEHVALSVFWSIFAITTVVFGLMRGIAGLRYFGLTLFAVTLLKVVTVDMSQVSTGYRILSFMALGLLLLGTSVLYGKVSPGLREIEKKQ